jgi:hypothetical protein
MNRRRTRENDHVLLVQALCREVVDQLAGVHRWIGQVRIGLAGEGHVAVRTAEGHLEMRTASLQRVSDQMEAGALEPWAYKRWQIENGN